MYSVRTASSCCVAPDIAVRTHTTTTYIIVNYYLTFITSSYQHYY